MIESQEDYLKWARTIGEYGLNQGMYENIEALRRVARAAQNALPQTQYDLDVHVPLREALAHIEQHAPWLLEED